MKTKKTRQELGLEEDIKAWKMLAFAFLLIAVFFIVFSVVDSIQIGKLKTQLSECQEQVPVWTLKFVCVNVDEFSKVTFEQGFTNHAEYQYALGLIGNKEYKLFENCEVIE